jgi:hypothetical protein
LLIEPDFLAALRRILARILETSSPVKFTERV